MIYATVCSGIEAPSVAWADLPWRASFFSEIEAFPRAVLRTRFPDVPLHGDFTTIKEDEYGPIDLLCAGTPCQDFSVAGLRAGLSGDRGALTLQYAALALQLRPRWLLWENVPGVLSVDRGRAFRAFLDLLGECGYGWAYRILDAQHFGVPQRRRRVFVVGYLGDWRPAAAVLFEPESLRGDSPPRREAGQGVASSIRASTSPNGHGHSDGLRGDGCDNLIAHALNAKGGSGRSDGESETFITFDPTARQPEWGIDRLLKTDGPLAVCHSLRADSFDAGEDGTGRGTPLTLAIRGRGDSHNLEYRDDGIANAILTPNGGRAGIGVGAVAFHENQRSECSLSNTAGSLKVGGGKPGQGYPALQAGMSVRRLTPTECERLMGFPDGWTAIDYRGKPAADGPRYRALGNSMAVPVVRWLGERIEMVDSILREKHR